MRSSVVAAALVVATILGTESTASPRREKADGKGATRMSREVELDYHTTVEEGGKRLRIEYTLHNRGKERVLVWDAMVAGDNHGLAPAPDQIIVAPGPAEAKGSVRFVRGWLEPAAFIHMRIGPGVRALEPGATVSGTARVDLPLKSFHPLGPLPPLGDDLRQSVLEVQVFPGGHETEVFPLSDGTSGRRPKPPWTDAIPLVGKTLPLPK
jgi:hypothetical protein